MIGSENARVAGPYTGNGAVSTYPFAFKIFQASDLLVSQTNLVPSTSALVLGVAYTVAMNADQDNNPGGNVVLVAPLTTGYLLSILSAIPYTQTVTLPDRGSFSPSVLNGALDRLTILITQLRDIATGATVNIAALVAGLINFSGSIGLHGIPSSGALLEIKNDSSDSTLEATTGEVIRSGGVAGDTGILLGVIKSLNAAFIQVIEPATSFITKYLAIQPKGGNIAIGSWGAPTADVHLRKTVAGDLRIKIDNLSANVAATSGFEAYTGTAGSSYKVTLFDDAGAPYVREVVGTAVAYKEARCASFTFKSEDGSVLFFTIDSTGAYVNGVAVALAPVLAASSGSNTIGWIQPWAGAVARTAQTKLRDFVNAKDAGAALDGVTNDTAKFSSLAQSSTNPTIRVPQGTAVLTTSPSAGGSSPLWIMEKGALLSGSGVLPGQVIYEEPGVAAQQTGYNLAPFTNDAAIQVRCGEGAPGDINFSYAQRQGGNGIWLWPTGGSVTPMRFYSIPGASGTLIRNVGNCSVNLVPGQALAFGTLYHIYANAISGSLDFNFSTLSPSFSNPFGFTPITGWACAGGDPRQRYVGSVQLDASGNLLVSGGAAPNGVVQYNLCSYYNRQRVTLQAVPTGASTQTSFSATGITNGLLASFVIPDGYEPWVAASGTVANNTTTADTWIGISLNGATPDAWQQIRCVTANYPMPFSVVYPGGSPNYTGTFGGRNTYQLVMKVTAGSTATLATGCIIAGSFEN